MNRFSWLVPSIAAVLLCAGSGLARAQDNYVDPPQRVARMAYSTGGVEFAPAGTNTWGTVSRNRPLITGDRLVTGRDGRAALELGDAAARVNDNSAFSFLRLDQDVAQIELSQGTMNLRVRQIYGEQVYEIDTPALAFVASQPGSYRIDVAPDGRGAMVTVFEGSGVVYGTDNTQQHVGADRQYRFADSDVTRMTIRDVPRSNSFDRFCFDRDAEYAGSNSRRYVSDNMVGYEDLDRYGNWQTSRQYGDVWYPRTVSAGWAPYRDGHWAWIEPWGWTWVDNAPWGFAPFHYGRWAYVGQRWGWVPGPRARRAVYAPALVAFIGGSGFSLSISSGGPVGWFPLGPRDIYLPPYRVSQRYFTSVNVTNIRVVNQTIINNYYGAYHNDNRAWRDDYAYRHGSHAVTVVPRDVFTGAQPVAAGAVRLRPDQLAGSGVALRPSVTPRTASLGVMPRGQPGLAEGAFQRTVVARNVPAPTVIPFSDRVQAIAAHGGAPLTSAQRDTLRRDSNVTHPRVDVLQSPTTPRGAPAARQDRIPVTTPVEPRTESRSAPRGAPAIPSQAPRATPATPRATPAPRATPVPRSTQPEPQGEPRSLPRGTPVVPMPERQVMPQQRSDAPPTSTRQAPMERVQPRGEPRSYPAPMSYPESRPMPERQQPAPRTEMPTRQMPVQRAPIPVERSQPRVQGPIHREPPPVIERRESPPQVQQARPTQRAVPYAEPPAQRTVPYVAPPAPRANAPRGEPAKAAPKPKVDDRDETDDRLQRR